MAVVEQMSQDEIDTLMKGITSGEVDVNTQALGGNDKNEAHNVATAMERLYFAQENGMDAEEISFRSQQLKDAAHALWLRRHGLTRKEWQEKVRKHFVMHPEHHQLLLLRKKIMHRY